MFNTEWGSWKKTKPGISTFSLSDIKGGVKIKNRLKEQCPEKGKATFLGKATGLLQNTEKICEIQPLTCSHKTVGLNWLIKNPNSHQLFASADRNAIRKPKRFIYPTVRCKSGKTNGSAKLIGFFVLPTRGKITANPHCTICHASRANVQTKACQRVLFCRAQRTD